MEGFLIFIWNIGIFTIGNRYIRTVEGRKGENVETMHELILNVANSWTFIYLNRDFRHFIDIPC